jgi:co-chaperonin GroES (HSP10)
MSKTSKVLENPFNIKAGLYRAPITVSAITPLRDNIFVKDMNFSGRQLTSGIMLLGDDGKAEGIRPRWGRVWAIGPEQQDVKVGQWVLIEHGRWSRGVVLELDGECHEVRLADPKALMMISDEEPIGIDTVSTAVDGEAKQRENWAEQ